MSECRPVATPADHHIRLCKSGAQCVVKVPSNGAELQGGFPGAYRLAGGLRVGAGGRHEPAFPRRVDRHGPPGQTAHALVG
ncbi:MAG: hypothetical protein ACK56F_14095, partial [bacterium]